jgi:hypothetical protein
MAGSKNTAAGAEVVESAALPRGVETPSKADAIPCAGSRADLASTEVQIKEGVAKAMESAAGEATTSQTKAEAKSRLSFATKLNVFFVVLFLVTVYLHWSHNKTLSAKIDTIQRDLLIQQRQLEDALTILRNLN